ncbi:hypothetical protein NBRC116188_09380 [Oceaniserpentilla sp. 4NH20-0058]|uniref:hypothetical protein n=1 Tax=Oceaniserpentilla sp. 4NH20-0058 TaxID=3127660 RepID=UPI0031049923
MTVKALLATTLCSAVLVGCGSGSSGSNGPSVSEYSLDSFQGRSVSTQSIVGTWVMTGTIDIEASSSQKSANGKEALKETFIIVEDSGSLYKLTCDETYAARVSVNGDTISFSGLNATLNNNSEFSGTNSESIYDSGVTINVTLDLDAVKISDSTNPLATLNISNDTESDSGGLGCVSQSNGYVNASAESVSFETVQTHYVDLERYTGDDGYTAIYTDLQGYYDYDTDYGDSVEFDILTHSESSQVISFNGSDRYGNISGAINVNLPVQ